MLYEIENKYLLFKLLNNKIIRDYIVEIRNTIKIKYSNSKIDKNVLKSFNKYVNFIDIKIKKEIVTENAFNEISINALTYLLAILWAPSYRWAAIVFKSIKNSCVISYTALGMPLHTACLIESKYALRYLLANKEFHIDIVDFNGNTPLSIACIKNNKHMMKMLMNEGAKLIVDDIIHEKSPIVYALMNGNYDLAITKLINTNSIDFNKNVKEIINIMFVKGNLKIYDLLTDNFFSFINAPEEKEALLDELATNIGEQNENIA